MHLLFQQVDDRRVLKTRGFFAGLCLLVSQTIQKLGGGFTFLDVEASGAPPF